MSFHVTYASVDYVELSSVGILLENNFFLASHIRTHITKIYDFILYMEIMIFKK